MSFFGASSSSQATTTMNTALKSVAIFDSPSNAPALDLALDLGITSLSCPGRAIVLHGGGGLDVYPLSPFSEPAMLRDHAKHRAPVPGFVFGQTETHLTALHIETEIAPQIWQRMAFAPNHSFSHPNVQPLLRFGYWEAR